MLECQRFTLPINNGQMLIQESLAGMDTKVAVMLSKIPVSFAIAEMAGFFRWGTAGEVHSKLRLPQKEHFDIANLSEETLQDMMWWNDLYDDGMPGLLEMMVLSGSDFV
ncbi:hypothetical protein F4809DRAFT_637392 [Biscogniauxia mediterranea]|nr:hypothetical protein F4809DRAFT_637392 [Biscogniauxia mediterranea]